MIRKSTKYYNYHQELRRKFGKASRCENKKCAYRNPKRYEWALRKGHQYSYDRKDYIQLCPSCHRKYDLTEETRRKFSLAKLGRPANNPSKPVEQFDLTGNLVARFDNISYAGRITGTCKSSIFLCLSGRYKTANGYLWRRPKN